MEELVEQVEEVCGGRRAVWYVALQEVRQGRDHRLGRGVELFGRVFLHIESFAKTVGRKFGVRGVDLFGGVVDDFA